MNFFAQRLLGTPAAFVAAGLIGIAFGFALERAGFGSSRKLTAIFYLKDFGVYQVMFTAVITAMLGLQLLDLAGVVEIAALHRMETLPVAQIAGGLLFGAGFVIGGWCPGTALVGAASGKAVAVLFLGGAAAGSVAFAFAWPALESTLTRDAAGVSTLDGSLGIPPALLPLAVVALAVLSFTGIGAWLRRRGPAAI
jgi:hypothetical protein